MFVPTIYVVTNTLFTFEEKSGRLAIVVKCIYSEVKIIQYLKQINNNKCYCL